MVTIRIAPYFLARLQTRGPTRPPELAAEVD